MAWIQQDFKGFRRIGTRISARHPNPLLVMPLLVMPGLVPGIHFHRRDGPEGDARNKSGHDGKGAFGREE